MSNPVKSASLKLDRVEQLLDKLDVSNAAETLGTISYTPDATGKRLVELLTRTADLAIDANVQSVVMKCTNQLKTCGVPDFEIAVLYAKSGNLLLIEKKLKIDNQPELINTLIGHAIDWIISKRDTRSLPTEHKATIDATLTALKAYEAKDNASAREALQAISVTSPLIEWKLFLRGLLACTENDEERANENFRRLNPNRLPARLARVFNDPLKLSRVTPADETMRQFIQVWRKAIAQQQPFAPLFRRFQEQLSSLSDLEKTHLPQLARCFYAEIQSRGHPDDLRAYKDVFGPPPLDPDFDRLQAIKMDRAGHLALSKKYWSKYATWLAKATPWPKPINQMVVAIIKKNEGELILETINKPNIDMLAEVYRLIQRGQQGAVLPKTSLEFTEADAIRLWLESHRLAPDWNEPLLQLLAVAKTEPLLDQVSKLCEEYLKRNPHDSTLVERLSAAYLTGKRYTDAKRHLQAASALHPLDTGLAAKYESVQLLLVMSQLGKQSLSNIYDELTQFREQRKKMTNAPLAIIQVVLESLDGQTTSLRLDAAHQVSVELLRVVISVLYKYKPALRTTFKATFNTCAASETDPANLIRAVHLLLMFKQVDTKFTGQGVIEKQLMTLLSTRILAERQMEEVEKSVKLLVESGLSHPQLKSTLKRLTETHPYNLFLDVYEFDYSLRNSKKKPGHRDKTRYYRLAEEYQRTQVERFKVLKPKLEEMKEQYDLDFESDGFRW